ncbi:hypothetical protein PAXINDRAFT_13673 [Paxillus involutus ATCC 200175]|uniref:Uncharacterized protein n=1 Tax=Paxillus involutus ATCC 200175 TaxID=664439 RepID=A0A0C9SVT7_PAXIN|nr:hypothetical protein PAXINDRAFT_13673 [Paxillus involutus ATCC 200175]
MTAGRYPQDAAADRRANRGTPDDSSCASIKASTGQHRKDLQTSSVFTSLFFPRWLSLKSPSSASENDFFEKLRPLGESGGIERRLQRPATRDFTLFVDQEDVDLPHRPQHQAGLKVAWAMTAWIFRSSLRTTFPISEAASSKTTSSSSSIPLTHDAQRAATSRNVNGSCVKNTGG